MYYSTLYIYICNMYNIDNIIIIHTFIITFHTISRKSVENEVYLHKLQCL